MNDRCEYTLQHAPCNVYLGCICIKFYIMSDFRRSAEGSKVHHTHVHRIDLKNAGVMYVSLCDNVIDNTEGIGALKSINNWWKVGKSWQHFSRKQTAARSQSILSWCKSSWLMTVFRIDRQKKVISEHVLLFRSIASWKEGLLIAFGGRLLLFYVQTKHIGSSIHDV